MRTARIFFVNRFYWPDEPATAQLLTDLAEGLCKKGYAVSIVAREPSTSRHATALPIGLEILRVKTTQLGKASLVGRALDFATFIIGARNILSQQVQPGDVVVTLTDPPLIGAALSGIIRNRGARQIHWVQDIFPEVAISVSGARILRIFSSWRDRSWLQAARCVVPGQDMANYIRKRGLPAERIIVSPNWAPTGVAPVASEEWRNQQGLSGKFLVMYSGNLGRVHDFRSIVPLAREFSNDPNILFIFVGDGARRRELERQVKDVGLLNVRFLAPQPRDSLNVVLSAGDLHLVTLRAGCEAYVFPSKLYGIAAVERPALIVAPTGSELFRIADDAHFGKAFDVDNVLEMAHYVRQLAASNSTREKASLAAREFSRLNGGVNRAVRDWLNILSPLIPLVDAETGGEKFDAAP